MPVPVRVDVSVSVRVGVGVGLAVAVRGVGRVAVRRGVASLVDIVPLCLGSPHVNFRAMGKNVILPEQTVRELLEAYASLAAWYYQLWGALRTGSNTSDPPGDAARAAFLQRLVQDYRELASVARSIPAPRMFVPPPPPPPLPAPYADMGADEPSTLVEPAPARQREMATSEPPGGPAAHGGIAPPPFVAPGTVKYDR